MSTDIRIKPGTLSEIGLFNGFIARLLGVATGGPPPNVFTTLAKHRRLFRGWLFFASGLMPFGKLKRRETELVILEVARLEGCTYEWVHHERLGKKAGITDEEILALRDGKIDGFSERERAFLQAARDLFEDRILSEESFTALKAIATEIEILEVLLLIGHYQMLARVLNSVGTPLDGEPID